jgi:hypothetical protein
MKTEFVLVLVLALGFVLGAIGAREDRKEQRKRQHKLAETPICACGHHLCFHNEKNGCHAQDDFDQIQCGCVKYMGPQFVETYIAGGEQ